MKKRLSIIISIIVILGIIVGVTLAWFRRDIFSQNVTFNFEGLTITYNAGNNISGIKLIPVSTLQKGVTDNTAIEKTITVSSNKTAYFNLYMDIETLGSGLKQSYVLWQLKKGNTVVNSGNFANSNAGDTITLLSDEEINSTTSTYTLGIWIDGTVKNFETVENQDYEFVLRADAGDETPVKVADKIIELAGNCTSYSSGFEGICATNAYDDNGVTKYHEYRYIGGEVDNYVLFNDELYRIIGVFDDYSHGVEGQNLVKLIRARELTAAAWGTYNSSPAYTTYSSYKNNWTGLDSDGNTTNGTGVPTNANLILNEYFYKASSTSTTYGECINWTYGSNNNTYKSKNCSNIVGYGIQTNDLRNYIEPVTWYLYGYTGAGLSKQNWYQCERNNYTNCTSANSGAYQGTTTAPIGLMYVSDYMYASGSVASNGTIQGSSSNFINLNWLYNGQEWTITPRGNSGTYAFSVSYAGNVYVDNSYSYNGYGLRPTFYLKSTIKIKSGNGTFANPYTIG